jgi:hypothetical protein
MTTIAIVKLKAAIGVAGSVSEFLRDQANGVNRNTLRLILLGVPPRGDVVLRLRHIADPQDWFTPALQVE